jgi:hypothetical protein
VIVATLAMLLGFGPLHENQVFQTLQGMVLLAFVSVVLFYLSLFFIPTPKDPILALLRKLESTLPKVASFTRIYEGVRNYHPYQKMVLVCHPFLCVL